MQEKPMQDVENGRQITPASVMFWLCIFAMFTAMLLGNVRLYEMKEENRRLAEQLEEYREEIEALTAEAAAEPDLKALAEAMGLGEPDPAAVKILHIRGTED